MRLETFVLAAITAGIATAAVAEDRYGPRPAAPVRPAEAPQQVAYDNAEALRWNGKSQAARANEVAPQRPQPLANGILRNTSATYFNAAPRASAAPISATAPAAAAHGMAPVPPTPSAPALRGAVAQMTPPPAPAQAPAPQAPVQNPALVAPLSAALFEGAPTPAEATASNSAATRARLAANAAYASGDQASPRLYSLHSSYGMTPDPIPLAQTGVGQ